MSHTNVLLVDPDNNLNPYNAKRPLPIITTVEANSKVKVTSIDGIAIYADSNPAPTADINDRQGWLWHKLAANDDKFNYYFYASVGSSYQYKLSDFHGAHATCVIDNFSSLTDSCPFINVYTKPTAEDLAAGQWYHTKIVYSLNSDALIVVGEAINLYCGKKQVLNNTNRYVHLAEINTDGPGLPTEEIFYMTIHTDSDAPINTRVLISTLGYNMGRTSKLINQIVNLVG